MKVHLSYIGARLNGMLTGRSHRLQSRRPIQRIPAISLVELLEPRQLLSAAPQTFYIDPINGSMSGDGSLAHPWHTLQEVVSGHLISGADPTQGVVHAGDTIDLMNGNEGSVRIDSYIGNFNNTAYITVQAYPGAHPALTCLYLQNSSNWAFRGLTISDPAGPVPSYTMLTEFLTCQNIVFDHNTLYSQADVSQWTPQDWLNNAAYRAIEFQGTGASFTNNTITNVRFGIDLSGDNIQVVGNTLDDFADDGFDVTSSDTLIQHNTITNHYGELPDGNHNDSIQGWTVGGVTNTNVTIDSNFIMASTGTDANIPAMQNGLDTGTGSSLDTNVSGISIFSGLWTNVTVTNNVVGADLYHGISLYGVSNSLIANNTVIKDDSNPNMTTWLMVTASPTGVPATNDIVRNNIANMINLDPGVIDDHNISLQQTNWWSNSAGDAIVDPTILFNTYIPSQGKFDLELAAGSPAIGAGSSLNAPGVDILGNVRNPLSIDDGGYAAASQAPSGTSKTLTTLENTPYTFSPADFGFSDPAAPANSLNAVQITTVPTAGAITDKGIAVATAQFVPVADIMSGKLVFTPAKYTHGTNDASFTFQVQDNGSAVGGNVNVDPSPKSMTVNVTAVNQAPVGTTNTVSTTINTQYVFSTSDFGFTDPNDSPPNALLAVKFPLLSAYGTLTDNGVAVTATQFVSAADIAAGNLAFTPTNNLSGLLFACKFQVEDNGGTANGGVNTDPNPKVIYINLTPPNHAPLGTTGTVTTTQNTSYTFKTADFGFSDPNDTPSNSLLAVKFPLLSAYGTLTDKGVSVAANQFVSAADIAAGNLAFTPTNNLSGLFFAFKFQVEDNGGTASGGVNTDPNPKVIYINLTPPNHAPLGTTGTVTTAQNTSYTFKTADFGFSDPNDTPSNSLLAVEFPLLSAYGTLTDKGVAVTANQFVSAADIAAGNLAFTPTSNLRGLLFAFKFQVEDTGSTAGGGVNIDPNPKVMYINVTAPK